MMREVNLVLLSCIAMFACTVAAFAADVSSSREVEALIAQGAGGYGAAAPGDPYGNIPAPYSEAGQNVPDLRPGFPSAGAPGAGYPNAGYAGAVPSVMPGNPAVPGAPQVSVGHHHHHHQHQHHHKIHVVRAVKHAVGFSAKAPFAVVP